MECLINTYKYFSTEDIIFIIREMMMYELDPASLKTYLESDICVASIPSIYFSVSSAIVSKIGVSDISQDTR